MLGGAHAVASYLALAPRDAQIAALCDRQEEPVFRRHLDEVHVCDPDLEGELIRALGTDRVLELLAGESFGTLQKQPAWREMPLEQQLRRFLSGRSGNKLRYAKVFVEALDLDNLPPPLAAVLGDEFSRQPQSNLT